MDSKSKIIFGALFGVVLISAFAYALPSSGRQNAFSWMTGGASQNSFGNGMMGGFQQNPQNSGFIGGMMGNAGFGMMNQQAGNGFNFSAMHGGNAFGMMGGNRSFGAGNAGFGMMGNWNGNGFNSSSMLSMHNLMHGTNLTSEEFANLHKGFQGFGNASANSSSSSFFGCPMHSGAFGDADDGDEQVGQSGNSNPNWMVEHHNAMHGGNGFGMMGGRIK